MSRITPSNLFRHELLGLNVKAEYLGHVFSGRVLAESRNMLTILTERGVKHLPKAQSRFTFTLPDGAVAEYSGLALVGRPHERIKARLRRW
ncbi:MAG: ribonuclease P protein subunit [Aigarchaeota archaeon]|nr:ribonuclease P protein subunit [Candidatus Pelearchaeum maunauluense]